MEKQIYDLLTAVQNGEQSVGEAQSQLLRLFNVVGRSESFVCGHPPNQTYLNEGTWHCEKCGGKWESIANK